MFVNHYRSYKNISDSIFPSQGLLPSDLPKLSTLKLGGLNHPRFLHEMTAAVGEALPFSRNKKILDINSWDSSFSHSHLPLLGPRLCCFKVETVHFDIDIHTIGTNCPALKELHIVNARVKVLIVLCFCFVLPFCKRWEKEVNMRNWGCSKIFPR